MTKNSDGPQIFRKTSAELFAQADGSFSPAADMHTARSGHIATMLKSGAVLVIGRADANANGLKTAELYQ
jgi:hypothetical protein